MDMLNGEQVMAEISDITGVKYSEEQKKIIMHEGGMCILACAGSGKALVNGTGVLTPTGYRAIEQLRIGDIVYGQDGKEQTVVGVFPQGEKQVYNVHFSDGTIIKCCSEHLWTFQTYNMRRTTEKWKTDTLENIAKNVPISIYPHVNKKDMTVQNKANIYIPMCEPIQFEQKQLPLKPYLLGALLGDGCIKSSAVNCSYSFSNNESDIVNRVNQELSEVGAYLADKGDNSNYRINVGTGYGEKGTEGKLTIILKELGLKDLGSHAKFIPDEYKLASIQDRLWLLQGLIDTDGHCNGTSYKITLASEKLIDDIKFIVETLGMIAYKSDKVASCEYNGEKKLSVVYRLVIKTSDLIKKIHWCERKESQWKKGQTSARRTVVKIEAANHSEEMTCIKVSNEDGLFITENCVVTHNTTVLTHLLAKRIKTGEIQNVNKLLCTTFSKAGSTEMEVRLGKLLKQLGVDKKVEVRTLHSSYYAVLKHFGVVSNNVCSNGQRLAFVTQSVKESGVQIADEDLQLVDSLLSFQVNNLMDDVALVKSYVYTLDDVSQDKYSEIRKRYNMKKQEAGLIDFDDMQMYMYMLLVHQKRQDVIDFCCNMWEYFFVDEFQDVSKIQFAILRALVKSPDKLIVIGDDDQCIYQWRGADPNIILNICGYYDIQRFVLSTNYRCGGEIVEHAAVGIKNNEKRAEKDMVPFNKGGKIKICDSGSSNLYQMSKHAYTYVMQLISERHVNPESIAVLSRNNLHLAILNNMLFKSGVYSESAPEMKLTNMSMYKDIKNILEIADNTYNHNIIGKNLWKLVVYLGVKGAGLFSAFMNETGCNIKDTIGYIISNYAFRNSSINWQGRVRIPEKANDKFSYRYSSIKRESEDSLILLYKALEIEDETERISALLTMYITATEFMHKSGDKARTVNGLVDYVQRLIKEDGILDTKSWLAVTEQYESGKAVIPDAKITMSTMHGAKGREWKHVILFAVDNVTFPSFEGINTMMSDGVDQKDISGSIDENRRLAYVGMTRAKEELAIFTDKMNMSIYLLESLGILKKDGYQYNGHIINMAVNGGLPVELIKAAEEKVFIEESPYLLKVNIGDSINRPTFIEEGDPDSEDFMGGEDW